MTIKNMDALWDEYSARRVRGKSSEAETTRIYERYVRPVLGKRRVDRIDFQEIEDLHHKMAETPYQANRVLALLRPMFKYAGALKWVPAGHNPAKDVPLYAERKRRRHMKPVEAPRIATEIKEKEDTAPQACMFLWLLIFTGARPSEIKAARWEDIHDSRIVLDKHKTVAKTGVERVIVLPPAAIAMMERLTPPNKRFGKLIKIGTPEYIWRSIRVDAKCPDLRIYDLRHTFGTYALELGYSLDQIGEALAHTDPKTTKIYAELTDRSRKRIAVDASLAILQDMGFKELQSLSPRGNFKSNEIKEALQVLK